MDIKKDFYYKVKYGYDVNEFVSAKNEEVQKAIYAMRYQKPIQIGGAIIDGKRIIAIEPYYHKYTGWYEYYTPKDGDDWAQIKRDAPDFTGQIEAHTRVVNELSSTNRAKEIGTIKPEVRHLTGHVSITYELAEKMRVE